jgi:arsenical pump membrane protein
MHVLLQTLDATWSPFVLVAGLLLIGHVASKEGLFDLVGSWCARVPGGGVTLFLLMMVVVAVVTAVLNLDTSVVFMTPVALNAARSRNVDETSFLFGTIFMSNSASLLLLGSNLTNLLVFERSDVLGATFAHRMLVPWLLSVCVTSLVVLAWRWRPLRATSAAFVPGRVVFSFGPGVLAAVFAVAAMLFLVHPALWIFLAGVAAEGVANVIRRRVSLREAV